MRACASGTGQGAACDTRLYRDKAGQASASVADRPRADAHHIRAQMPLGREAAGVYCP
jgi:hypothetical protein